MGQTPHSGWNSQDQEISELEAELARAYQVINQLRQQNAQLQNQIVHAHNIQKPSKLLAKTNLSSTSQKTHHPRQASTSSHSHLFGERLSEPSQLRFIAIATTVATVFMIAGLVLTRRHTQPTVQPSTQPSVVVPKQLASNPAISFSPVLPQVRPRPLSSLPQVRQENLELVYNVRTPPNFKPSQELQSIVDKVVNIAATKGLSTAPLSITLIDVNSREIAGYQQQQMRFPASVVKLFWMVVLYEQLKRGFLQDGGALTEDLYKMINKSDNEAASRILDRITGTESGTKLSQEEFQTWLNKRQQVNRFFQNADYEELNISQKTFPIPYLKFYEPKGRDLQMRGDSQKPIRNKISTQQAARLMYEIVTGQAVSPEASQTMAQSLIRDLTSEAWEQIDPESGEFNPVRTFFGESLPTDVQLISKAGWTSGSRQEVAFVRASDGGTAYILAIFAEDRPYAHDWKIFPTMSRLVFDSMVTRRR